MSNALKLGLLSWAAFVATLGTLWYEPGANGAMAAATVYMSAAALMVMYTAHIAKTDEAMRFGVRISYESSQMFWVQAVQHVGLALTCGAVTWFFHGEFWGLCTPLLAAAIMPQFTRTFYGKFVEEEVES